MKKFIFWISIVFNVIIIFGSIILCIFLSKNVSFDENNNSKNVITNFDSINKLNKVKFLEISPSNFSTKVFNLSKNKTLIVVFWVSWCKYCPSLIKALKQIENDPKFNFNYILISTDKPNAKGRIATLKKIAQMDLRDTLYTTNQNVFTDISNSKSIYKYLPKDSNFDKNPGFPYLIIFKDNKIIYEDSGFDDVYGLSKFLNLLYLKK